MAGLLSGAGAFPFLTNTVVCVRACRGHIPIVWRDGTVRYGIVGHRVNLGPYDATPGGLQWLFDVDLLCEHHHMQPIKLWPDEVRLGGFMVTGKVKVSYDVARVRMNNAWVTRLVLHDKTLATAAGLLAVLLGDHTAPRAAVQHRMGSAAAAAKYSRRLWEMVPLLQRLVLAEPYSSNGGALTDVPAARESVQLAQPRPPDPWVGSNAVARAYANAMDCLGEEIDRRVHGGARSCAGTDTHTVSNEEVLQIVSGSEHYARAYQHWRLMNGKKRKAGLMAATNDFVAFRFEVERRCHHRSNKNICSLFQVGLDQSACGTCSMHAVHVLPACMAARHPHARV